MLPSKATEETVKVAPAAAPGAAGLDVLGMSSGAPTDGAAGRC
ncbi:MAG TPA: hypothetical protein VGC16_02430 [Rhizomicrobium sp.]